MLPKTFDNSMFGVADRNYLLNLGYEERDLITLYDEPVEKVISSTQPSITSI
jgi:hypothetical protein